MLLILPEWSATSDSTPSTPLLQGGGNFSGTCKASIFTVITPSKKLVSNVHAYASRDIHFSCLRIPWFEYALFFLIFSFPTPRTPSFFSHKYIGCFFLIFVRILDITYIYLCLRNTFIHLHFLMTM